MFDIEKLLQKQCYIIDFLPKQVPANSNGQFFRIENYLLNNCEEFGFGKRFICVILKLMCYYCVTIGFGESVEQVSPEKITEIVKTIMQNHSGTLELFFPEKDTLLILECDCMNLSVYNPDIEMQELLREIAVSEGLFFRKAAN